MVPSTASAPGVRARWLSRLSADWQWICAIVLVPIATWWAGDFVVLREVPPILDANSGLWAMRSTRVLLAVIVLALVLYALRALWGNGKLRLAVVAWALFGFAVGRVFGSDQSGSATVASLLGVLVLLCRQRATKQALSNSGVDPDAPIESSADDLFDRGDVVGRCVKYLANPHVKCPRLAVFAPYGRGKSSVAMLVRERLLSEGHRFVRFDPWHHTQDEHAVLDALLLSIDEALGRGEVWMGLRATIRRTVTAVVGKHEWAAGIRTPIERFLLVSNKELAATLAERLVGKRLVVFVDDLERCSAEVAERVLTTVKETFSVPGLAFLFAIDRGVIGERLKKRDAGDLLDKVFDDSVDLSVPSPTALSKIEAEALAHNESWRFLGASLRQLSGLLPQSPRRRKRFLQRLQSWPGDLASVQTVLELEVALALMLLEFDAPGSLEYLLDDQDAMEDLQSGAFREAVAKALDKDAEAASLQPSACVPWSKSPSAEATHAWIRNRSDRSHSSGIGEHVRWLLARELPSRSQLLEVLHDIPLDAPPDVWLERLSGLAGADDRAVHDALIAFRERQIEAAAGVWDFETQKHYLRRAVRVSEVRKELLRRGGKPLLEDISSFERAFHGLLRWAHFGGDYREAQQAEWKALQEHVAGAGDAAVEIHLSVFSLQSRAYMDPADVARIVSMLCTHTRPGAEHALRVGQMECVRRILRTRKELLGASYRMLVDLVDTVGPILDTSTASSHEDWDMAHGLFESLSRAADQPARSQQQQQRLATAVWRFLTSKRLNRRMAGSLSEILQVWEGQPGNPELPKPDWWAEATAKSAGGWVPDEA